MAQQLVPIPSLKDLKFGEMSSDAICLYLDLVAENEAAAKAPGVPYMTPSKGGPVVAMYSISRRRLPLQTAFIVNAIHSTNDRVFNLTLGDWYNKEQKAVSLEDEKQRNLQLGAFAKFKDHDPSFAKNMRIYDGYTGQKQTDKIDKMNERSLTPSTPGAMRSWHQNDGAFLPVRALTDGDIAAAPAKARMYHEYIVENIGLQNKQKKKGVAAVYTGYIEYQVGGWFYALQDGRICYDYYEDKFYFTATHYQQKDSRVGKNPWWHVHV